MNTIQRLNHQKMGEADHRFFIVGYLHLMHSYPKLYNSDFSDLMT